MYQMQIIKRVQREQERERGDGNLTDRQTGEQTDGDKLTDRLTGEQTEAN